MKEETKGALLVMSAGFLWGTLGITVKAIYSETTVNPLSLALFRLLFAIPILTIPASLKGFDFTLTRREALLFSGFGFCSLTVFQSLYLTSFAYTTAQHAVALLYTAPSFVAVLSRVFLKERMTRNKILAVILSTLGAFLIVGVARGVPLFGTRTQIGDWLAIGSGLAYSTWYIFGKFLGRNREPAVTSIFAMCFGAIFLLPVTVTTEGLTIPIGLLAWGLVAFVGIFPTALAYLVYIGGLKSIDATKASVFALMEPLSGVILAFLFLGERLSYDSFLGFVLIIGSIFIMSKAES